MRKIASFTRWYMALVVTAGVAVAVAGHLLWPVPGNWHLGIWALACAALVGLALAFPMKVSPQTSASLASAPLLMAALLLPPGMAGVTAIAGSLAADVWLRRPLRTVIFNGGMVVLAVPLASLIYRLLSPLVDARGLLNHTENLGAALLAGVALLVTNMMIMAGLLSLMKGRSFWSTWSRAWRADGLQEAGALALGILGARLSEEAWWSVVLLALPLVIANRALSRSVDETRQNIKLSQKLKEQMEELQATQAQLVQSARLASVGTLAAGVAHEINNPLFVIQGKAELLLRHPERHLASERAKEFVQGIFEMAHRASTIVGELLAFSRSNGSSETIRLSDMMDVAVDLVGGEISKHGIFIQKEYESTPSVKGMANKLQQVFINLLLNAKDAMPQGGTITLRCWAENGSVKASVRDMGCGIPRESMPHLFEPFFTTKEVGKGTGLGLFMCHRIVTEHQGRISVSSEDKVGTEVVVEIPATTAGVLQEVG